MLSPRWLKVLRDLKDNRSRTVLSVLSIAIGVIAFGGMLIARNTVVSNLNLAYNASNPTDITLDLSAFDRELLRWVKIQPGVKDAAALSVLNGTLKKTDGTDQDATIYAFADYSGIVLNKLKPVAGQYPPARAGFSLERAKASTSGLTLGQVVRIKLVTEKEFDLRYTGVLYDVTTPAGPAATRWNVYIEARTLADLDLDTRPSRIVIQTEPSIGIPQKYALAEKLTDELGKRGFAVRGVNVNERNEHWAAATAGGIILILVLVGAVALIMSGFLIMNVVNGLLLSQKKIIGIMKIVGADRWQIFGVYLVMMASLGALALLIAMPLSIALGTTIAGFISGVINFDVTQSGFTPAIAALEIGVALLVPLAFSAGPIWSALRITPAEAISDVTPRQTTSLLERILAKFENVPRILMLAFRSLFRNNVRLVVTMLTLVVAGGIFISILNLRDGIPTTLKRNLAINNADITLSFGAPVSRIAAVNRALQTPGVAAAEGWLVTQATVVRADGDGSTLILNGGEADARSVVPPMASGRWLSPYSAQTRDELVLSIGVLDSEPNLKVGDVITLKHLGETHLFRIIGFVSRLGGPAASTFPAFSHYQTIERVAGVANVATSVRVMTTNTDKAFTDPLAEFLRKRYEDAHVNISNVSTKAALIGNALSALSVIITLMIVVATLIGLVGGLGLAGTMSLNVMERTREVGVMRAVGAESPDLRLMFVAEGLFIGLLSAVISFFLSVPLSLLIGSALGTALRFGDIGLQFNWVGYALWPLIVSVVSIIASISPARRASQISIREALAYA